MWFKNKPLKIPSLTLATEFLTENHRVLHQRADAFRVTQKLKIQHSWWEYFYGPESYFILNYDVDIEL